MAWAARPRTVVTVCLRRRTPAKPLPTSAAPRAFVQPARPAHAARHVRAAHHRWPSYMRNAPSQMFASHGPLLLSEPGGNRVGGWLQRPTAGRLRTTYQAGWSACDATSQRAARPILSFAKDDSGCFLTTVGRAGGRSQDQPRGASYTATARRSTRSSACLELRGPGLTTSAELPRSSSDVRRRRRSDPCR